jgi:hypothetical protein
MGAFCTNACFSLPSLLPFYLQCGNFITYKELFTNRLESLLAESLAKKQGSSRSLFVGPGSARNQHFAHLARLAPLRGGAAGARMVRRLMCVQCACAVAL